MAAVGALLIGLTGCSEISSSTEAPPATDSAPTPQVAASDILRVGADTGRVSAELKSYASKDCAGIDPAPVMQLSLGPFSADPSLNEIQLGTVRALAVRCVAATPWKYSGQAALTVAHPDDATAAIAAAGSAVGKPEHLSIRGLKPDGFVSSAHTSAEDTTTITALSEDGASIVQFTVMSRPNYKQGPSYDYALGFAQGFTRTLG